MRGKRLFKGAVITAAMVAALAFPMAAYAEPAEGEYETKYVDTWLFDKDHATSTVLLFKNDLPTIPYIDAAGYINTLYKCSATEEKQTDGTILISTPNGTLTVDTEKDTLYFPGFSQFLLGDSESASEFDSTYLKPTDDGYIGGKKETTFNLGAYNIDLLEVDGKAYVPLPTMVDLFSATYNGAQYLDGKLYYLHTTELMGESVYYDNKSVYERVERSAEEAEFTYNELCFLMDRIYGAPAKAAMAPALVEKGFDQALEADETMKEAKKFLKSTNFAEYYVGLGYLDLGFFDGGHTNFATSITAVVNQYSDSALSKAIMELAEDPAYEDSYLMVALSSQLMDKTMQRKEAVYSEKMKAILMDFESVESWKDGEISLYTFGDTALFSFDEFENGVIEPFKWSVDYAAKNGYKNFIVDLSTNQGGVQSVVAYMLTLMKNKNRDSNQFTLTEYIRSTDETMYSTAEMDLNLDGKFNDADKKVGYDLNFAILESGVSFSSGNLMPVLAKEYGIAVLGECSSGGECMLTLDFLGNGIGFSYSGMQKSILQNGTVVDMGATPHYELVQTDEEGEKDYSSLYDTKLLSQLIHEYYGDFSNEWVNGTWYNKNGKKDAESHADWKKDKTGWYYLDVSGWYPKNRWQKIDGKWYFFDAKGYLEQDAYRDGYYLSKNGAWDGKNAKAAWKQDKNGWWYAVSGGYLKNCWKKINGKWYFFKADGYAAKSEWVRGYYWISGNSIWSYQPKASWKKDGSGWKFGDTSGWFAKSATYTIGGVKYTFDKDGHLVEN